MLAATTLFPPTPYVDPEDATPVDAPGAAVTLQDMLRARLPRLIVTPTLLVGIVAVYLLMVATSGEVGFSPRTLVHWGAQFKPAIALGQWWRLLTAMWLHANPIHLALNALFLWRFGSYVERLLGHGVFLIVYLLAGVVASVVSLQFQPGNGLSVGASGALFGLVGVLLMVAMTSRGSGTLGDMLAELRPNLISVVGTNLMLGFVVPGIDNAAHLGGLGGGLVLGWLVGRHSRDAIPTPPVTLIPIVMTAAIAATAVIAVGGQRDVRTEVARVGTHIDDAEAAFRVARADIAAGRRTAADVAADAERTLLPLIHDAQGRADAILRAASARASAIPGGGGEPALATAWQMCLARYDDAWRLRIAGLRGGDAGRIAEGNARAAAAIHDLSKTLAGR